MTIHPVLIRIPYVAGLVGPQNIERQRAFARRALEHSARLIGAPPDPWPATPERVPLPRDGFHWSISHKPRFAAAVVAREPIGIDIEEIAPRGRDLSPALASEEEWQILCAAAAGRGRTSPEGPQTLSWLDFFRMWTAKESALKSNSKGIGGLKACRLARLDNRGRLIMTYADREFPIEHFSYANHIASCISGPSRLQWHVMEG